MDLKELLVKGAGEYGVNISDTVVDKFFLYKDLLKSWNEKMNLTAIEEDNDIIIKHFIDSLSIIPYVKESENLVDIGTGAGFPGIPLKIVSDELKVTLLDSLSKRVGFLNEVVSSLSLSDIRAVHGRAEDYGVRKDFREAFDTVVARAVASLPVLIEYCLPFVKVGGVFIAMKGSSSNEAEISGKALLELGGEIEKVYEILLPFSDMKRNIIIIRKFRQTPSKYPRKAGKPSKEPLL
ncbi:MAG TPA: 16S rRNA (guanine(527)-N(7))-methyltransferase RsmG [Clostridia bacterium]